MTIHGLAEMESLPNSVLEVNKFWQTTAYNISGYVFSLDDIEHGILRGWYWWAPNYRRNSIIGCRVILGTSNADLQNLKTVLSAARRIKARQKILSNYNQ